jgi:hypothetical protein
MVYLLSNPHANMLGLYYMPKLYIAHETPLGTEGASKGLPEGRSGISQARETGEALSRPNSGSS